MAITFVVILIAMGIMTMINPMTTPKAMPEREGFDGKPDSKIVAMGVTVVVLTLILYAIFW